MLNFLHLLVTKEVFFLLMNKDLIIIIIIDTFHDCLKDLTDLFVLKTIVNCSTFCTS